MGGQEHRLWKGTEDGCVPKVSRAAADESCPRLQAAAWSPRLIQRQR